MDASRGRTSCPTRSSSTRRPGAERLVAVFSDAPLKADDVEAALEKGEPDLKDARVVSLEFVKGPK